MRFIYLCEDQEMQRKFYEESILEQLRCNQYNQLQYRLSTDDPEDILRDLNGLINQSGIYFLDIQLGIGRLNGLETASRIRQADPEGLIVFLTAHDEFSLTALQRRVQPFDYIIKQDNQHELKKIAADLHFANENEVELSEKKESFFSYSMGKQVFQEPIAEIDCFETTGIPHKIVCRMENKEIEFRGELNEISERFPTLFRGSKSTLINLKRIQTLNIKKRKVAFVDGKECKISYRQLSELRKVLGK